MLNRIRVRGKLFLLLTTPLLAVVLFAYIGVVDRLDTSSAQTREEALVRLADSGSDLGQAVSHERLIAMMVDAGSDQDLAGAAAATHDTIMRWLENSRRAKPYIGSPATVDDIDTLTSRLQNRASRVVLPGRSTTSVVAELSILSRSIRGVNDGLVDEADDLNLFKTLVVQGFAGEMQNAATEIAVVGATSIRSGDISKVALGLIANADAQLADASVKFQDQAGDVYVSILADLRNATLLPRVAGGISSTTRDLEPLVELGDVASQISWLQLGLDRIDGIHGLSEQLLRDASLAAAQNASAADQSANNFMILAMSVALAALLMAVLIGRSISHPLVSLSRSAKRLSTEELPALVESMRTGGKTAPPDINPIAIRGRDEVADLANALSEIQRVTIDVAEEQTVLLQRGISAMFVNLARRNQSLLDRQIQFIDGLEADEEDADRLKDLFRLDHLASRMRRNAESLLVLAGAEPSRRRGKPVTAESIMRVAVSEIEDYSRVDLVSMDDCLIPSAAAVDLAHMASELMENATQFSPPNSRVDVLGHRTLDGTYQVTVVDHGIGMTISQITRCNRLLSDPPVVGLDMGRSLGLTVVARIADRLGTAVRLTPTPGGGVTAAVSLPTSLVVEPATVAPSQPASSTPLTSSEDTHDIFDMFGAPNSPAAPSPAIESVSIGRPVSASQRSLTSAGLVRRTPGRANLETTQTPPSRGEPASAKGRTPEQVREMLTRYRGGLQRGRQTDAADTSSKTD